MGFFPLFPPCFFLLFFFSFFFFPFFDIYFKPMDHTVRLVRRDNGTLS